MHDLVWRFIVRPVMQYIRWNVRLHERMADTLRDIFS